MVVMESDLQKALRILHQSLFSDDIVRLHLYMAGTGAIGRKLLEMIERQKEYLAERKISLEICGLINSRKMIVGDKALSGSQIEQFLFDHAEKAGLGEFVDAAVRQNLENSVFVDVTAADEPVGLYHSLLSNSIAIVAANKRANTQGIDLYNSLQAAARRSSTPFHYETNVGAGLPVIGVLRSLMASGDSIIRIDAVLSGTMNYLLSEYTGNQTFTDLVRYAERNHYTEPDPRDDLSGMDVARKCLILARECGWPLELEEIRLEPLMTPEAALAPDKASFYRELEGIDIEIHHRFERATAKEKRLRYVARVECGTASVSVMEVDEQHPFYGLRGTENCISLTTKYYQQYPMVIKGPGAGVDVTSAGVLADIVRIAEGLKR
jgi:aspartokinase/homoserine dehydrogenase 1